MMGQSKEPECLVTQTRVLDGPYMDMGRIAGSERLSLIHI